MRNWRSKKERPSRTKKKKKCAKKKKQGSIENGRPEQEITAEGTEPIARRVENTIRGGIVTIGVPYRRSVFLYSNGRHFGGTVSRHTWQNPVAHAPALEPVRKRY